MSNCCKFRYLLAPCRSAERMRQGNFVTYSGGGQSYVGHSSDCWVHWDKRGASIHRRCSVPTEETWLRVQVCRSVEELHGSATKAPDQSQNMVQSPSLSPYEAVLLSWTRAALMQVLIIYAVHPKPVYSDVECSSVRSRRLFMSALASSAELMSCWCPLWKEEQEPCCPASGEERRRRSFSWFWERYENIYEIIKRSEWNWKAWL